MPTMRMEPTATPRRIRGAVLLLALGATAGCGLRGGPAIPEPDRSLLLEPGSPAINQTAPDSFLVRFETTKGEFVVQVFRDWAPRGADRFYNLVRHGYYDEARFFRNISGFMAQFGIHGDPRITEAWRGARIPDDPVTMSNTRGTITFATAGPNSRTVQLFINHADNSRLDAQGFAPFGRVIQGMETVDALYTGYGEGAPRGLGPLQDRIQAEGNAYLDAEFPLLDHIVRARLIPSRR